MDAQPAPSRRDVRPERPPHHISAVAHLFFAEGTEAGSYTDLPPEAGRGRDLAVACLGEGRSSAWACAGLVRAARFLGSGGLAPGVRLTEDPQLAWSAGSHLVPDRSGYPAGHPLGQDQIAAGEWARQRRWVWAGAAGAGWLRWAHFGALDDAALVHLEGLAGAARTLSGTWGVGTRLPGHDGLVVCLPEERVAQLGSALTLGRLIQAVGPQRLELLVLPRGWVPGAVEVGSGTTSRAGSGPGVEDWTRLVRRAGVPCPVTATIVPRSGQPGPQSVLRDVCRRLTGEAGADFSMDLQG